MRKLIALIVLAAGLSACTPADEQYCSNLGVAGTRGYGNCITYYHKQEQAFDMDRAFCDSEADGTYPRTLYDTGHYQPVFLNGGFGPYGRFYGGGVTTVFTEPDYYRNQQVDALRMRIVEPCMQARGWNSGASWQAGRHNVRGKIRRSSATIPADRNLQGNSMNAMPWLN